MDEESFRFLTDGGAPLLKVTVATSGETLVEASSDADVQTVQYTSAKVRQTNRIILKARSLQEFPAR